MREIKFRGMTMRGMWQVGLLSKTNGEVFISNSAGRPLAFEVRPETVGEFTGLKDKNGVEIYEGDIVDNGTGKYNGEITFENGCFLHRDSPLGYFVEDGVIEDNRSDPEDKITLQVGEVTGWAIVIGNIYENHELLDTK